MRWPETQGDIKVQNTMQINNISRPRSVAPPIPISILTEGRVTYVGRPFAGWAAIRQLLVNRNLDVCDSTNARELPSPAELAQTDVVLLGDGDNLREAHELCSDLRHLDFHGPILLLTSANDPISRVLGLENGADAWAAPDSDARSTVAQIRALLRRQRSLPFRTNTSSAATTIRAGALSLNSNAHEVSVGQSRLELSRLEFELLWNLAQHADQIVTRERLAAMVGYGESPVESRAVDTLVARLRRRLGPEHAGQIRTVRSIGYVLRSNFQIKRYGNVTPSR